jgi:hypothetical protein
MGYHLRPISKGVLGEASKIQEELDELLDAEAQQNKILAMVELTGSAKGSSESNFGSSVI